MIGVQLVVQVDLVRVDDERVTNEEMRNVHGQSGVDASLGESRKGVVVVERLQVVVLVLEPRVVRDVQAHRLVARLGNQRLVRWYYATLLRSAVIDGACDNVPSNVRINEVSACNRAGS